MLIWLLAIIAILIALCSTCNAETIGEASWYSIESCKKEGTWAKYGGLMANGKIFDDTKLTCAMWDVAFGSKFRVTNVDNGRSVIVTVTDRGPSKRLVKKGRIIDLSKQAFFTLSNGRLDKGVLQVQIEKLNK